MDIECLNQIILCQMYLFQICHKFMSSLETSLMLLHILVTF